MQLRRCSVWFLALAVAAVPLAGSAAAAPEPHRTCEMPSSPCHAPATIACCCEDSNVPATPVPAAQGRLATGPLLLLVCPRGDVLAVRSERLHCTGDLVPRGRESLDLHAFLSTFLI